MSTPAQSSPLMTKVKKMTLHWQEILIVENWSKSIVIWKVIRVNESSPSAVTESHTLLIWYVETKNVWTWRIIYIFSLPWPWCWEKKKSVCSLTVWAKAARSVDTVLVTHNSPLDILNYELQQCSSRGWHAHFFNLVLNPHIQASMLNTKPNLKSCTSHFY